MFFKKKDWLVYLAFLVLTLLFFHKFLSGGQIFGFKDLSRYFYPLRYLMVEQVRSGILPLWNPYIFCGFPLLATLQIGFFYPLSAIHYFLPFNLAFNYYIILHYFLAACFMFMLLKHYQLGRVASFAGGIIFAFSGYLLSVSNMNTSLSSVIWLPLILICFDRLLKKQNFINIAILGILLAVQFLGGEPTIIYVTLFLLMAYALIFTGSWISFFKSLGSLAISGFMALGLVAVQLLPFMELAKFSDRTVRTAYDIVTFRSFPPREMINFIFPYFYGNPAQFGGFTETLVGKIYQDWLLSPYLGILPLIFVFMSFKRNKKLAIFFFISAVVALFLAFGKYTPVYRLVYLLPGISMIRYPVKYLFLLTFSLSILAAFGFDWLLSIFERKDILLRLLKIFSPILGALSLVFIIIYFFRQQIFNFLAHNYSASLPEYFFKLLAEIIEFNILSFLFIVLYILAFTAILLASSKNWIKKTVFSFLIILLVVADLFANSSTIAVPVDVAVFNAIPKNYEFIINDKSLYRFFYTPELGKENQIILGEDYNDALLETKDNFCDNWHIPYHFQYFFGYESIKPMYLVDYYRKTFTEDKLKKQLRTLSRFNVKYIASTSRLYSPELKLLRHKDKYGLNVYLYENNMVFPRAYVLNAKGHPRFSAKIVKYRPREVVIIARSAGQGHLFLADAYYPGWRVWVDGQESQILPAEEIFRKVALSPGKHEVRFVYDPLSFKIGAVISSLTVLGLIVGGWLNFKKNR